MAIHTQFMINTAALNPKENKGLSLNHLKFCQHSKSVIYDIRKPQLVNSISTYQSKKANAIFEKFNSKKETYEEYLSRLLFFSSIITPKSSPKNIGKYLTLITKNSSSSHKSMRDKFKKANSVKKKITLKVPTFRKFKVLLKETQNDITLYHKPKPLLNLTNLMHPKCSIKLPYLSARSSPRNSTPLNKRLLLRRCTESTRARVFNRDLTTRIYSNKFIFGKHKPL